MAYLIGIDTGTSGTKAVLLNEAGSVLATAIEEYPLQTPRPGWAEQDPEQWWQAACTVLNRLLENIDPAAVAAIGLSGQMHGSVFLDCRGQVIRPAILWCDQRTVEECEWITTRAGGRERLIELCGNPALTGFTAPKIVWLRNNEPDNFARVDKVLLPKDYIRFRLTGSFATEVSDASGTLLFDVAGRRWSEPLLQALDIPATMLPECFESTVPSASISAEAATKTGLVPGTPVVGGGGDQAAQAVGSGIVRSGLLSSTIGTSGVVFAYTDRPSVDPAGRLHTFCHAVPGKWHVMGVMLSAGGALQWFRNNLCRWEMEEAARSGRDAYDIITARAAEAAPGSEGLLFLPYLSGERAPYADPYARGVFYGLSLRHTMAEISRSVLEGVAFGLRDSLDLIRGMGVPISEVRTSGGGARSDLWRSIQADINGLPMKLVNAEGGAAFGAALLAGVGAGLFDDVQSACDKAVSVIGCTEPDTARGTVYEAHYAIYRRLYPALSGLFNETAALLG